MSAECLLISYVENSSSKVYWLWNVETKGISSTDSVIIDKQSQIENNKIKQERTVEWPKQIQYTTKNSPNREENDHRRLDTIIAIPGLPDPVIGIHDSITVHQPSDKPKSESEGSKRKRSSNEG